MLDGSILVVFYSYMFLGKWGNFQSVGTTVALWFAIVEAFIRFVICLFKNNGPFSASYSLFSSFRYSWQFTNRCPIYKFAEDWIRTADLSHLKRLLYQLSHNNHGHRIVFDAILIEWSKTEKEWFSFLQVAASSLTKLTKLKRVSLDLNRGNQSNEKIPKWTFLFPQPSFLFEYFPE